MSYLKLLLIVFSIEGYAQEGRSPGELFKAESKIHATQKTQNELLQKCFLTDGTIVILKNEVGNSVPCKTWGFLSAEEYFQPGKIVNVKCWNREGKLILVEGVKSAEDACSEKRFRNDMSTQFNCRVLNSELKKANIDDVSIDFTEVDYVCQNKFLKLPKKIQCKGKSVGDFANCQANRISIEELKKEFKFQPKKPTEKEYPPLKEKEQGGPKQ